MAYLLSLHFGNCEDYEKGSFIYNNALLWYVGDGTDDD